MNKIYTLLLLAVAAMCPNYVLAEDAAPIQVADNIAAMNKLMTEDGVSVKLMLKDAKVTYVGDNYAFVEDATGGVQLDWQLSSMDGVAEGNALNGYIYGKIANYAYMPTLAKSDSTVISNFEATETTITPAATTIPEFKANAKDMLAKFVSISNVKFGKKSVGNETLCYLISGTDSISLYDNFYAITDESGAVANYETIESATGIVGISYDGDYEFWPVEVKGTLAPATEVDNIADLKKLTDGTDVKLTLNNAYITVNATMGWSKMILVEDATGVIQVNQDLANELDAFKTDGVALNGYVYGKFYNQYGEIYLMPNSDAAKSDVTATPTTIVPKEVSISEAATPENEYRLVILKDVHMVLGQDGYSVTLEKGDESIVLSDNFTKMPYEGYTPVIYDNLKSITGFTANNGDVYMFIPYGDPAYVVGTTTGISDIQLNKESESVYSINGTLVRKAGESLNGLSKGLYIMGGKKIVIK